jgi:hypothetical protein
MLYILFNFKSLHFYISFLLTFTFENWNSVFHSEHDKLKVKYCSQQRIVRYFQNILKYALYAARVVATFSCSVNEFTYRLKEICKISVKHCYVFVISQIFLKAFTTSDNANPQASNLV